MHGLVLLFHTPCVLNLQPLEQREVGLKESWLVISFKLHQHNQHLCLQNTDVDVCTPHSLYIRNFTLYPSRRLQKTF